MPDITLRILGDAKSAEDALAGTGAAADKHLGKLGKKSEEASGKVDKVTGSADKAAKATSNMGSGMKTMAEGFAAATVIEEVSGEYEANEAALVGLNQAMIDTGQKASPQFKQALADNTAAAQGLGFEASDTTGSLQQLIQAGVSWKAAMGAQNTIMDLARAKNISLADATTAVIQGMQGNGKALKALNIELPPHIATTVQLDAANQRVAKSTEIVAHDQALYTAAVKAHGPQSAQASAAAYTLQMAHQTLSAEQQKAADIQKSLSDRTGNLGQLLGTLDSKVGGQAKAHTHDMAVEWDIVKAKFDSAGGAVIKDLLPALGGLLSGLGFLADHANIVIPLIGTLTAVFVAMKIAAAVSAVVEAASVALDGLGVAMDFVAANPLVIALGVIIAVLVALEAKFHFVEAGVKILGSAFQAFGTGAGIVFQGLKDTVVGVWTAITGAVKSPFDAAAGVLNGLIDIVNGIKINIQVPGWVPGIGGKGFNWDGLHMGHIPSLASGSPFAYVGPQGALARIFDNPEGERMQTRRQARDEYRAAFAAGRGAGGGNTYNQTITVPVQTNANAHDISREVAWAIRTKGR